MALGCGCDLLWRDYWLWLLVAHKSVNAVALLGPIAASPAPTAAADKFQRLTAPV